jgi:hypothetical protein
MNSAFLAALAGFAHGGVVAFMFVVALALLMASPIDLAREIRLQSATIHLDRPPGMVCNSHSPLDKCRFRGLNSVQAKLGTLPRRRGLRGTDA